MAKYESGKTSPEVQERSDKITNSIKEKTRLIVDATSISTIPDYIPLNNKKSKINIGDVHAWESKELGIIKYSYNSAKTIKNKRHLTKLIKAILDFNQHISEKETKDKVVVKNIKSNYKSRKELETYIKELKNEISTLDRELIEIFRAYKQLQSFVTTQKLNNKQYHEILRLQAQTNNSKLRLIE